MIFLILAIAPAVILGVMMWLWHKYCPHDGQEGSRWHYGARYFFLLRYQWLFSILLFAFPWIVMSPQCRKYLINLMYAETGWDLFFVTVFSFFAAVALITGFNLTLINGQSRFGLVAVPLGRFAFLHKLQVWAALALTLPLVWKYGAYLSRHIGRLEKDGVDSGIWYPWVIAFAAYNLVSFLVWVALEVRNKWTERTAPPIELWHPNVVYPVAPKIARKIVWAIASLFRRILGATPPEDTENQVPREVPVDFQPHNFLAGYRTRQGDKVRYYPGHLSAILLCTVHLVAYFGILYSFDPNREGAFDVNGFPPLGFLLLLLGLWHWILPAVAFFMDYWRIPVPIIILLFWGALNVGLSSDHYYAVWDLEPSEAVSEDAESNEDEVVAAFEMWLDRRKRAGKTPETVFVVTCAGGGIVASAWTAEVLASLESYLGQQFNRSLLAISSVSGGSVGTVFYLLEFDAQHPRPESQLDVVRNASLQSSLPATAWAMAGVDFWRFLRSFDIDRGTTLQEAWRAAWSTNHGNANIAWPSLQGWRKKVLAGTHPVVLLNCTSVDDGAPYLFAPLKIKPKKKSGTQMQALPPFTGFGNFVEDYPKHDVELLTAARLSATFPWITPISRAANRSNSTPVFPHIHLADGGYFDNFGIVSLTEYLDRIAKTMQDRGVKNVVLIDISPWTRQRPDLSQMKDEGEKKDLEQTNYEEVSRYLNIEPLVHQILGPFQALYNARGSSQAARAESEIRLLEQSLAGRNISLRLYRFYMEDSVEQNPNKPFDVPLSWHLAKREKKNFTDAREKLRKQIRAMFDAHPDWQIASSVPAGSPSAPASSGVLEETVAVASGDEVVATPDDELVLRKLDLLQEALQEAH